MAQLTLPVNSQLLWVVKILSLAGAKGDSNPIPQPWEVMFESWNRSVTEQHDFTLHTLSSLRVDRILPCPVMRWQVRHEATKSHNLTSLTVIIAQRIYHRQQQPWLSCADGVRREEMTREVERRGEERNPPFANQLLINCSCSEPYIKSIASILFLEMKSVHPENQIKEQ